MGSAYKQFIRKTMIMSKESLNLSWTDFEHSASESFRKLLSDTTFADVTLVCDDDKQITAHKVMLVSSSEFFRKILTRNPHQHPLIYLTDVNHSQLKALLSFIYLGETEVGKDDLDSFMKTAKKLGIEGLMDHSMDDDTAEEINVGHTLLHQNEIHIKKETSPFQDQLSLQTTLNVDETRYLDHDPNQESNTIINPEIETKSIETVQDKSFEKSEKQYIFNLSDGEAKFQCRHCDKSFTQPGTLNRHVKVIHAGVRYQCSKCEYEATYQQALKKHSAKSHPENL